MHIVDICKIAYIALKACAHIILFHFILKTFPTESNDPSLILHFHLSQTQWKLKTQNAFIVQRIPERNIFQSYSLKFTIFTKSRNSVRAGGLFIQGSLFSLLVSCSACAMCPIKIPLNLSQDHSFRKIFNCKATNTGKKNSLFSSQIKTLLTQIFLFLNSSA